MPFMRSIRPRRLFLVLVLVGLGCAREKEPGGTSPGGTSSAAAIASPRSGDAGQAAEDSGAAEDRALGDWVDATLYRFRLDEMQDCTPSTAAAPPPATATASAPPATATATALPAAATASAPPAEATGPRAQLGITVSIEAKINEFAVSPRDVTLQSGGVILQGRFPSEHPIDGCPPPLPLKQLKAHQVIRGSVLFDVPPGFHAKGQEVRLVYKPTRWGGAQRIEVPVPECLGACPPPPASSPATP